MKFSLKSHIPTQRKSIQMMKVNIGIQDRAWRSNSIIQSIRNRAREKNIMYISFFCQFKLFSGILSDDYRSISIIRFKYNSSHCRVLTCDSARKLIRVKDFDSNKVAPISEKRNEKRKISNNY